MSRQHILKNSFIEYVLQCIHDGRKIQTLDFDDGIYRDHILFTGLATSVLHALKPVAFGSYYIDNV